MLPTVLWYGGQAWYGMVDIHLPTNTILWYGEHVCLQFYGMVDRHGMVLWYGEQARPSEGSHLQFRRRLSLARPPTKPNSSHTDDRLWKKYVL